MKNVTMAMGKAPKQKRHYGNLSLVDSDFPGAGELKIGEKVTVQVEVEVTGLRKPDKWDISEGYAKATDVQLSCDILSAKGINAKKK